MLNTLEQILTCTVMIMISVRLNSTVDTIKMFPLMKTDFALRIKGLLFV